ncbi:MAG: cbb3-type cytochrome c oxidase subunit I [Lentisphaeria bacterium]|nr:cbb3-type cytochrome c oxidase subunit I [Lentisphaeria bacterium]
MSTEKNYLNHPKGLLSWLITVDHKRIAILYTIVVLFFFFVGGVYASLIRLELAFPNTMIDGGTPALGGATVAETEGMYFDDKTYNKIFTMHGIVMVFLVIIPATPAILGNFLLPILLGAKDVAFPRLNLASWYVYMLGAGVALTSLIAGGVDTGWTFYTPFSTLSKSVEVAGIQFSPVIAITLGAFILGFSSIFTGINFIVTIHKMRPPGMTWFKLPLFLWGMYATSLIQVLATPVLGVTLGLLILEKVTGAGIFDPALGGDPILFQHFFWFYSHPAVYIMILPAFAVISEMVAVHSHRNIFGYKLIGFSSVAIALLGSLVWGHHMFVSGQSEWLGAIFSFLTFFIGIPSGIKVFNWLATMYKGEIKLNTSMFYVIAFLINFAIGGLTGIFLGTLVIDINLHDTYFVVAHFHYVMMGSGLFAFFGGMHHWWPKIFGKMYNEIVGILGCLVIFVGFNITFLSQFYLGLQGMPRRYHDYSGFGPEEIFSRFHGFSSVGTLIMAIGFVIIALNWLHSLFAGKKAPSNPWGGLTLEWATTSPPPTHNFHKDPEYIHGPYDYDKILPENIAQKPADKE